MNTRKPISSESVNFPDPSILPEDSDGLVHVGGNLEVETLVKAYSLGIFPWPLEEKYPLFWFCPEKRGVIDFSDLHIPRSLKKIRAKEQFHFTFNKCFKKVMQECAAQPRPGQEGTWITKAMIPAYEKFHKEGYAHSIECWQGDTLVGGLYGVYVKGVFSGESMFYKVPNASKLSLITLVEKLGSLGLTWMDIQMTTPVTQLLGGHYISRKDFLLRLKREHQKIHPAKISL